MIDSDDIDIVNILLVPTNRPVLGFIAAIICLLCCLCCLYAVMKNEQECSTMKCPDTMQISQLLDYRCVCLTKEEE